MLGVVSSDPSSIVLAAEVEAAWLMDCEAVTDEPGKVAMIRSIFPNAVVINKPLTW